MWAWLYQWFSILREIYLQVLFHVEGPAAVASTSSFWFITVFVGLLGILVTNVLGVLYFYRDNRLVFCVLAACDLDTPFLVATQAKDYVKGGAPDIRELRRRNALWRGLPCAAVSVFVATRGVAQTSICQYVVQMQMAMDRDLHRRVNQEHPELHSVHLYPKVEEAHSDEVFKFQEKVASLLRKRLGEDRCPVAQRRIQAVTTLKDFLATSSFAATKVQDVRQFQDLSAMQVSIRQLASEIDAQAVRDNLPALKPLKLTSESIDKTIRDGEIQKWGKEWNEAGMDRAFIVTYSNPRSTWLFLQAAVQLLVAVSGLGNQLRKQRRIPFIATVALCVHIFLDALLTIGCFVMLFAVMPGEDRVMTSEKETQRVFHSIISGRHSYVGRHLKSKMFSIADILIFEGNQSKAEQFFQTEIFPSIAPHWFHLMKVWVDFVEGLHSPDLSLEEFILVKVMVIGVILYGVLRCITTVGIHVFVTSPVVLLDEERAEPLSLVLQVGVKTAAVLAPYVIAASSWIEFQVVIATMFGLLVRYRFVYHAMLGIYVTIFAISGIAAVALLRQDDVMAGDGPGEELQLHTYPPQQGCCIVDRKKHKPTFDTTTRRVAEVEQGAVQGVLGQRAPNYGGCELEPAR